MQLVIPYKEKVTTTSRLVATKFEKLHNHVMSQISNLKCSPEFFRANFELVGYTDSNGNQEAEYVITRDGFTFLVMRFTGEKAAQFQEEFINEFNKMEALLRASTPVLLATYQLRILSEPTENVPDGYWSVFDKSHSIMLLIEVKIGSINQYDLVDGSIGKRWSQFRKDKPWAVETKTYIHEYNDSRGDQECKCYHRSELQYFDEWLSKTYKRVHLSEYLRSKYKREKNVIMLEKVNHTLPKLLNKSA